MDEVTHNADRLGDEAFGTTARPGGATVTRRVFLQTAVATAGVVGVPMAHAQADAVVPSDPNPAARPVELSINGRDVTLQLEPRVTLLDALREYAGLTGTKKGCDRGQCGACTVLLDGRRVNACLMLAMQAEGSRITTVEGLASGDPARPRLAPLQVAFIEYDAFQCGFCTPGQLCSATAVLKEIGDGSVSAATPDVRTSRIEPSDAEIRERMSGNLCRCGAYPNIVRALRSVANGAHTAAVTSDRVIHAVSDIAVVDKVADSFVDNATIA